MINWSKLNTPIKQIKVYVHLGVGYAADVWNRRYKQGLVPDLVPYGYHHAEKYGFELFYSKDFYEKKVIQFMRRVLFKILGFDFIHAWRNRKYIFNSDLVWTHTEYENLAVAFLLFISRHAQKPKLIANCIWLFDRWNKFSWWRKKLYSLILQKSFTVLTVDSPLNLRFAKQLFPMIPAKMFLFGISMDSFPIHTVKVQRPVHNPIHILSLGSDIHRDWHTFVSAFANRPEYEIRVASGNFPTKLIKGVNNLQLEQPQNMDEIRNLYAWSDIVVIPLKPNMHASGITVILEAVSSAVPVIATDTGGLDAYFSGNEIKYVGSGRTEELISAVYSIAKNESLRFDMTFRAQKRLLQANLTTEGYVKQHVLLTKDILNRVKTIRPAYCTMVVC